MAITSVRTAAGFPHPRCCVGMALRVGHHGITLVSCQQVSSGQAGGCTIAAPSKGPDRNRKVKTPHREEDEGRLRHCPPLRVPRQSRGCTWLKISRCLQGQHRVSCPRDRATFGLSDLSLRIVDIRPKNAYKGNYLYIAYRVSMHACSIPNVDCFYRVRLNDEPCASVPQTQV